MVFKVYSLGFFQFCSVATNTGKPPPQTEFNLNWLQFSGGKKKKKTKSVASKQTCALGFDNLHG
jgi:hypothetical protein